MGKEQTSQVVIFGSFTEDELRSFQKQLAEKNDSLNLNKQEFVFGSLKFTSAATSGGSTIYPKKTGPLKVYGSAQPSKSVPQKSVPKNFVKSNGDLAILPGSTKEDTTTENSLHHTPLRNGVTEPTTTNVDSNSISVSQNKKIPAMKSTFLEPHGLRREMSERDNVHNRSYSIKNGIVAPKNGITEAGLLGPRPIVRNLLPRGLINTGNLCFLIATLQALLSCSPFVHLLQEIRTHNFPKKWYPTLSAFLELIFNFEKSIDASLVKNEVAIIRIGSPFNPVMFAPVLLKFTPDIPSGISSRPRQEDAEEFLSFVMNQIHDELLHLEGYLSRSGRTSALLSTAKDDGREAVGTKHNSAVTRVQCFIPSKLSPIVGGMLNSFVQIRGNKPSIIVEPFLVLHLNIFPEAVSTIQDALYLFSAPETIEGYRTSDGGKDKFVTATKSVKIQSPPKILIFHLMRFTYGSEGSAKLHKPVHFPVELLLGRELFVSCSPLKHRYELVATITHHGMDPSSGHYTADTRYSKGQWIRCDDAVVSPVSLNMVLHGQAYLLFYKHI